jgi:diaminopimelate decarboxylase
MTDLHALAAKYGTPAYLYDLDRIAAAKRDLFAALPEEFDLYFAAKANPHPELLREMRAQSPRPCRAEISSLGELDAVLEAGFTGAEILYTGPGKTHIELTRAIACGVRLFSTESLTDLRHVGAAAQAQDTVAECLLRINSASAAASTSIRMTGTPSQFGFDSETLADLRGELEAIAGARIVGAHFFPLSNAKDEDSLLAEFQHTIGLAAQLQERLELSFSYVDIGGGFAAPYATPGSRPIYDKLRVELQSTLDLHFPGWRSGRTKFACESGRYLVGDCGRLLAGVVNLKESRGRRFVILDAGINAFGGMSGLGRLLPVAVQPQGEQELTERASLVGPLCTPGDILGRDVDLPALQPGDVLTIPNAGAYGPTASLLMFLGRPAPVEIAMRGGEVVSASRITHVREAADAR